MAKGLRSSVKKANRTKLRSRVFQPAEDARAERLHAKLLETIQQDKPEPAKKNTMDIDTEADNAAQDATKEDEFPKGSSFLTASIPRSLSDESSTSTPTSSPALDPAQENTQLRNLCFYMGLCSDIVGFTDNGDLQFAFDPLPPHWLSENQGLTVKT